MNGKLHIAFNAEMNEISIMQNGCPYFKKRIIHKICIVSLRALLSHYTQFGTFVLVHYSNRSA